jgi:hypothetical protein
MYRRRLHESSSAYAADGHDSRSHKLQRLRRRDVVPCKQIFPDKIRDGLDTRTTIMIRNIPNLMTVADLRWFVDEKSPNAIDVIYLSLDARSGELLRPLDLCATILLQSLMLNPRSCRQK